MSDQELPQIRIALLGVAHYHAQFWAEAIGQTPDEAELIGIWDDNEQRGREAATRFESVFEPDLARLLSQVDAAGITAETIKHRRLIEACAASGVHVFCEKPLATSLDDCMAIAEVERTSGIVIRQSFPKRTDPINDELRALVEHGVLGEIQLVRIRHGHRHGLDPAFLDQWYSDPALSGGGTLIDEGVHAADFLRWLFGSPSTAMGMVQTRTPGLRVEDTACATFQWPSGLLAEVAVGWNFVAGEQSIEIFGTEGTAVVDGVDIASRTRATVPYLRWYRQDGERVASFSSETVPRFVSGGFHNEGLKRFIRLLRGGPDDLATVADGIAALEMIFAAYASAVSGRTEPVGALAIR